jgi:hypothetical protein
MFPHIYSHVLQGENKEEEGDEEEKTQEEETRPAQKHVATL